MYQCERNGLDLSLDFGFIEVLEMVEQANAKYQRTRTVPPDGTSAAAKIRHYCGELFVPINEIYEATHGSNICDKIFNDPRGVNFDDVADFYRGILNALGEHGEMQAQRNIDMANETAARQARIKQQRDEFKRLNEANRASNAAMDAEEMAASAADRAEIEQQRRDTSVPVSDMSARPLVPPAIPTAAPLTPAHTTIPGNAVNFAHNSPYASEGSLMVEEQNAQQAQNLGGLRGHEPTNG